MRLKPIKLRTAYRIWTRRVAVILSHSQLLIIRLVHAVTVVARYCVAIAVVNVWVVTVLAVANTTKGVV